MLGSDTFVSIFGSTAAGDDELLIKIAAHAIRSGLAIVFDKPGEKKPLCILSAVERNRADKRARDEAALIGDPRFHLRKHKCGLDHAVTLKSLTASEEFPDGDPKKVAQKIGVIIRRLAKAHGGVFPNIGVELGLSRLLVVDVDTTAELEGFRQDWSAQVCDAPEATFCDDLHDMPGMTVKSPGKLNDGGEWVHKNGGHYWFTLPADVELPAGQGALKAENGWVAMWDRHQVLAPPSTRAEGAYELIGNISEAPSWLLAKIMHEATARMDRARNRELPDGSSDIDQWSAGTPWGELLEPEGWTDTGLPDRCSCPIWTAPGDHASPKSATAHDVGCDVYDDSTGHAPIHVWTDSVPEWLQKAIRLTGSKTFTKLGWLSWRDHEGVTRSTLSDLGMSPKTDTEFPGFTSGTVGMDPFDPIMEAEEKRIEVLDAETEDDESPFAEPGTEDSQVPGDSTEPTTERTMLDILRDQLISSADLDLIDDPEPLVQGMLDMDTVNRVTGKSNHGKTFYMIDVAGSVAIGKAWHGFPVKAGLVVYMVAEGVRGFKKRVRAWERKHNGGEPIPADRLRIMPNPIQTTDPEKWVAWRMLMKELGPVLVIFDTQARITVGIDENDAKEMGMFIERMEQIRRGTGACVVLVHHLGHNGEHGRGSSAVLGALNTEIRIEKQKAGSIKVHNEKQKDEAQFEPLAFTLTEEGDSAILVPDGWTPAEEGSDPFDVPTTPRAPGVTADSPTRDRLAAIIWNDFGGEGTSRAEAAGLLRKGHPVYGFAPSASIYRAWNELIGSPAVRALTAAESPTGKAQKARPAVPGVLLQQTSPATGKLISRWKLDPEEAARLGLPDPGQAVPLPPISPAGPND
jgi:hypothetical protein